MTTEQRLVTCQICLTALEYEQLHSLLTASKKKFPDCSDWIVTLVAHMEEAQREAQEWDRGPDDQPDDEEALSRG